MTTYCVEENKIWCGCFIGDLEEFKRNVLETHFENPKYLAEYLSAIEFFDKQKLQEPRAKGEL